MRSVYSQMGYASAMAVVLTWYYINSIISSVKSRKARLGILGGVEGEKACANRVKLLF